MYNACDDTAMKMGDWLDLVADTAGLPRPPRVARDALAEVNDFMSESRRLDNTRLKRILEFKLRYPTVHEGLAHANAVGVD